MTKQEAKPRGKPLIMAAPNGARLTKKDHPAIPVSIAETVETAQQCFDAGASALHLHVRQADGTHSLDAGLYREAISELANVVPQMRVQITTEAVGVFSVAQQLECLQGVQADWASISVRELARAPDLAASVYSACEDMGTEVQHILYDQADAKMLKDWQTSGIVRPHQNSVLLVLGRYSENQISDPQEVQSFHGSLAANTHWMLCAFGAAEHDCLKRTAALGGNCRVGFENSRTNSNGQDWPNNAASVSALCNELLR